jgi:hypothetical protein
MVGSNANGKQKVFMQHAPLTASTISTLHQEQLRLFNLYVLVCRF